ncbi:hypothetical protein ACIRF8_15275 [Streptomyces sp. NPDC102406]|uniref:hypothetical protein n=1 Tax=Streptomyces sp. NPDC102406 TaxID=3366171 RepID=UPI0038169ED6
MIPARIHPGPKAWIAPVGTDAGGEGWQRLEGIASIEFGDEVATVEIVPDLERFTRSMRAAQEAVAAHMARTSEVAQQALQALTEAVRDSGDWVDTNGDPVQSPLRPRPPLPRRDGRPAWETPHGPARRRR